MPRKSCLFLLAVFLCSAPSAAQYEYLRGSSDVSDRDCGDGDGADRCDPDIRRPLHERYGALTAEELLASGATVRRTMFFDAYGSDVAMVSISRGPNSGPSIRVTTPLRTRREDEQPLQTFISERTWERAIAASDNFHLETPSERARQLGSEPEGPIPLCFDGWFVVAEAIQQPFNEHGSGSIRRDTENVCDDGLAVPFGFELARIAVDELAECTGLIALEFRNEPMRLATCHQLRGDRLARQMPSACFGRSGMRMGPWMTLTFDDGWITSLANWLPSFSAC